jgi:hypothetical protein
MTLIRRCEGGGSGRWSCRRTFGAAERAAAEGTRTEWERALWLELMRSGTVGWPNPPFSQRPRSRTSSAFAGQILKCSKGSKLGPRAVGYRVGDLRQYIRDGRA